MSRVYGEHLERDQQSQVRPAHGPSIQIDADADGREFEREGLVSASRAAFARPDDLEAGVRHTIRT